MAYTTIDDPTIYFNTKLYTGTGSSNALTGIGFQPDWVWLKSRSAGWDHEQYDSVRGVGKSLSSVTTNAEQDSPQGVTAFGADGFTVGTRSGANENNSTYVAWNWLGGGSASSNSNGSITSSVSANTTAGFSIVSYTGTGNNATVGHGLGSNVNMVIIKDRDVSRDWILGHTTLGFNKYLLLNSTAASTTASNRFQDTAPSSSVFTIGTHGYTNNSGSDYIAYCFAEKKGYSKFGSYTGNANNDGTFVYLGFKPSIVICKKSSSTGDWELYDNKRNGYNGGNVRVHPSANDAETGTGRLSLLSNGFKITTSSGNLNGSGNSFIYMAFAESPFVTSTGIPTTAR